MLNIQEDIISQNASEALKNLREFGVTILRGFHEEKELDILFDKTFELLDNPNILGSNGFYIKNPYTKFLEGLLIDKRILAILLDQKIIDICENLINDEILLQEIFVKHDIGSNLNYFNIHCHREDSLRKTKNFNRPYSVGFILYTHDTEAGAFLYAPKSHKQSIYYGSDLSSYPSEIRTDIRKRLCRINGKKGDIILFDHRGFHGPEQPVTTPRTVFIGGFHSSSDYFHKVKVPTPVFISDLVELNDKQLHVLGIRSTGSYFENQDVHYRSFKKTNRSFFKLAKKLIDIYLKLNLSIKVTKRKLNYIKLKFKRF